MLLFNLDRDCYIAILYDYLCIFCNDSYKSLYNILATYDVLNLLMNDCDCDVDVFNILYIIEQKYKKHSNIRIRIKKIKALRKLTDYILDYIYPWE